MTEHETINALRQTPVGPFPAPWKAFGDILEDADGYNPSLAGDAETTAYVAAAVSAAPHLLAEVGILRAQVKVAKEALAPLRHEKGCDALAFRPCDCGAEDRKATAVTQARQFLGIGA